MNIRKLIWEESQNGERGIWRAAGGIVGAFSLYQSRHTGMWLWECDNDDTFIVKDAHTFEEAKAAAELHFERHAKAIIENLQEPSNDN